MAGEGTAEGGTADCGLWRKASPCGCRPSPETARAGRAGEASKPLVGGNPKPLLPSKELLAQTRQAPRTRGPSWEGSELRGAVFSVRKETDGCQPSPCPLPGRSLPSGRSRSQATVRPPHHLEGADIEGWPTGSGRDAAGREGPASTLPVSVYQPTFSHGREHITRRRVTFRL